MSIRFRFTLIYTLILALTLTAFGFALYTVQAQDTLNSLKRDLSLSANKLADAALKGDTHHGPPPSDQQQPPDPIPFDQFSSDQAFQGFFEREINRILDPQGNLISSPFGRQEEALPLSSEGLLALQNKQDWWETAEISSETLLIYSRPVIVDDEVVYIVQAAAPLTERNRTLQSLATTLLTAGLLTTIIAFGLGWLISGITIAPIHRITNTAKEIGEERDFSRRVDYQGPQDEVGQLASTFNAMLARLQDAFQKVEHTLETQRNFLADVSHELRTPLTTLRGNLGLLRRNPAPEEQADILTDMVDESDRLIRLVNDLLLLARADAGRNLTKETIDVSAALEDVIKQTHLLAPQRTIRLNGADQLQVTGDRDAFKQVIIVALDNALKHSSGDVNIDFQKLGAQIEIRVQDFGEGIPPEKLLHIFDRFYRGEEDNVIPGFGLGLSIAKTLVERQDGEIEMHSEVGKGSTLILRFHSESK